MAPFRHVLGLIYDNCVPVGVLNGHPKPLVVLESINGNDRPIKAAKGIRTFGHALLEALLYHTVQPGKANGKAHPELFLKRDEHGLGCDHQDTLAATTDNQFAAQDACLNRLSQANIIGYQNAGTGSLQCPSGRLQLVGHQVNCSASFQGHLGAPRCCHLEQTFMYSKVWMYRGEGSGTSSNYQASKP